mmetsp:Transcript_27172/g.38936  ORF Transcript_27172/g.38936 Transcript_27172/m.38936 type:complete len:148 (+) Transcript_27172:160-603(+)|eukprot:CAMPEP_0172417034 /NCGR_PEP_ID=MMETSP1064-20121228/3549_1 /TAXON_ID=202472 /ORGANISM="Aulacoseira subarctica , Strain CCAP 1002/5" /LENGTH=147 /DNA_ID=CAMNT_0013155109 /DNA_START=133 /DNA_END=576 /DNA_ORIENTATION=+
MKLLLAFFASMAFGASAFAPLATNARQQHEFVLQAESSSRKAFLSRAASVAVGAFLAAPVANAGTMSQRLIEAPTEQWETGSASAEAAAARKARAAGDGYVPIKRLNLERKSPITRLDINAPDFTAYKKSLPGLYKTLDQAIAESKH